MPPTLLTLAIALLAAVLALAVPAARAQPLESCRLKGIERAVRCGQVKLPENPDAPQGRQITVHFAVVPAMAKNKAPDPLFVFAGGPGQAAMQVAAQVMPALAQLNARRDIIFVDQRGTGRSNALQCDRPRRVLTVSESLDPVRAVGELEACLKTLDADVAQYATWIAMRDIDAVRAALGADQINLWGGSYGTRAALEYLRQFPQHVRSVVIDGVAPSTMALPASFAIDSDAALRRLTENCAQDERCKARYPTLAADIDAVLNAAAKGVKVNVVHPITGAAESVTVDRTVLAGMLRSPLYVPQLAALLPHALSRAGHGDYGALLALYAALSSRVEGNLAEVMHFAVVCAEDMPRVTPELLAANRKTRFGTGFFEMYDSACRHIPTRPVPPAFYDPPTAPVPVLILSGGADPVTPPRHGELVAKTLPNARHFIAPNLGHGVTLQGCAPELISRFVRAAAFVDDKGKPIEGACLQKIPAPFAYAPPGASVR
jgi:pimeloyl-ACP methyl ester carboxylesterase